MELDCNKVFVVLGTACNMGCKYCIQHPIVNTQCPTDVSPDMVKWLDRLADRKKNPLEVRFYGGEPLLYFDAIKKVIGYSKSENISWGIITNGLALNSDMVNFLNAHKVKVALSWDGDRVKETRGYDVLADKEHRGHILDLYNVCVNGVISAKNLPLDFLRAVQKIDDEYFAIHKRHVTVNTEILYGAYVEDASLWDFDWDELDRQMEAIIDEHQGSFFGQPSSHILQAWVTHWLLEYFAPKPTVYCRQGDKVLNVDLAGNLYLCHNVRDVIGHISMPTVRYVLRIKESRKNEEKLAERCAGCPADAICHKYCVLINEADNEEYWCRLRRRMLTHFVKYVERRRE